MKKIEIKPPDSKTPRLTQKNKVIWYDSNCDEIKVRQQAF
jgi:hypothetical protein